jgi:hypothetical protein
MHRPVWVPFGAWVQQQGAPPLPDLEFIHTSERLNPYVYPEVIDYMDRRPLDARRRDGSRATVRAWEARNRAPMTRGAASLPSP